MINAGLYFKNQTYFNNTGQGSIYTVVKVFCLLENVERSLSVKG